MTLKEFAFDVLGDFMPERAYNITEVHGKPAVVLLYPAMCSAPIKFVRETWAIETRGTAFESVPLYA